MNYQILINHDSNVLYRFIQYHILLGGPSTRRNCGKPKSRNESIVLQYSNDAGKYNSIPVHRYLACDYIQSKSPGIAIVGA